MNARAARAFTAGMLLASLSAWSAPTRAQELNLWVMSTTEQQQQDMRELLRPFLAGNPGVRVNVTVLNWESAWAKITAAAASGKGPDVIELGTTWVPAVSSMGALAPISERQQNEVGRAARREPAAEHRLARVVGVQREAVPRQQPAALHQGHLVGAAGIADVVVQDFHDKPHGERGKVAPAASNSRQSAGGRWMRTLSPARGSAIGSRRESARVSGSRVSPGLRQMPRDAASTKASWPG